MNYPLYLPNDPLIIENKVYVTELDIYSFDSSLYCLNAETGDHIWDKPVGEPVLSPTIGADGKIFFGCMDYYTYTGSVKCFDFDGNSLWTYPLQPFEVTVSAPAYCDGKVYFTVLSIYSYQGELYCLNAENGQLIWSEPVLFAFGSPVCTENKVFLADFNIYSYSCSLKCFDAATGSLLCESPIGVFSFTFGTPTVSQDSVYIVAIDIYSSSGWLYKFFINCTLDWKVQIPGTVSQFSSCSPVCSINKVIVCPWEYYGLANTIYCMEIENGNVLWSYTLDYESTAYPSIADERVYIADSIGNIYAFEDPLKINKISGGILCVKAEIKNKGSTDITNVSWTIDVVGGLFNIINKHADGDIPTLQGNKSETVRAFPVIGLGNVDIEVSVSMPSQAPIKKNINGLVLGLIVIVKS